MGYICALPAMMHACSLRHGATIHMHGRRIWQSFRKSRFDVIVLIAQEVNGRPTYFSGSKLLYCDNMHLILLSAEYACMHVWPV